MNADGIRRKPKQSAEPSDPRSEPYASGQPVSIVIPSLDDRDLLKKHLPPLLEEVARRGGGDEVLVVDDTGKGTLAAWLATRFPDVRALARGDNGGFAKALYDGVESAAHDLVFAMNPDILVHKGFLDPLIAELADPEVHSVVPRILLFGNPEEVESLTEIAVEFEMAYVRQQGLEEQDLTELWKAPFPVNYGVGGALLLRRQEFLDGGGFDRLYEPFYYEDVDLGFAAWRSGRRVLLVPDAIVEHHHRGSIGKRVDAEVVRAVIERNRYLFHWKFLDDPQDIERHLAALERQALDAYLRDERAELVWLTLALERLEELQRSRGRLGPGQRNFEQVCRESAPHPDA